ncbi:tRNA (guanine(26)-N(2))-dimethyltransferase [Candidatus Woesearchaeota archaeon]|nr:tRNA (guanine(26)-N(2))-dimethyltransferase [Candidatus Woesearchaeota archaeon]
MFKTIIEGKAKVKVPVGVKISKEMPVFYNPAMKLNRDISVLLLNCVGKKKMQIADPLAGSGVRGIRFLLELEKGKIESISFNDSSQKAVKLIKENINLNKKGFICKKINIFQQDANLFLLESKGFDYIDVDPFGSPNKFLNSAVERIARQGIIAVTATDTSALSGSFPKACLRKYWAMPKRNHLMHEIGVRILIRKVQLIGAQFDKALTPIFSYADQHYHRIFLICEKGKTKVDKMLKQHGMFEEAGPMWLGQLWDKALVKKMAKQSGIGLVQIINNECKLDKPGFYDIHKICKKLKIKSIPKFEKIIEKIKDKGFKAARSHFNPYGIRSNIAEKELVKVIKSLIF